MKNWPLVPVLLLAFALTACRSHDEEAVKASADGFIVLLASGRQADAFGRTAFDFRTQTPYAKFQTEAQKLRPDPAARVVWQPLVDQDDGKKLVGSMKQQGGGEVVVTLLLSKEITDWKVSGFSVHG
jgi:hypothetical protein